MRLSTQIDQGVKTAVTEAIEKHRKLGQPITIWRDGKVITLTASEIPKVDLSPSPSPGRRGE